MSLLAEGRIIGGFRIGRMLGHGAMGEVYRAEQLVLSRSVAVKRILPQVAASPGAIERLAREARVLASVKSPFVVQVHDLVQADGEILLVMELIEGGGSLRPWCGRLRWLEACALVRHLAEALAAAHAVGVIHRDVKPDNALLANDGTARLGDFGLARALDATQITAAGSVVGTPAYLAPECRDGTPGGQPADIYSLGCTWHHLLTGQPPYKGSDVSDLLRRHAEEPPPDPSASGIDAELARLLAACLGKRPEARPTAAEVARVLAAHERIPERLQDVPLALPTALAPTLTPATAPTAQPATAPTATPPLARRRRRWLIPAIGVGFLVLVTVAVYAPSMIEGRSAEYQVVRRLAEIGQFAEARNRINKLVERDPAHLIKPLVRDVDLAEARQLYQTGREEPAFTAYRDVLRKNPGDWRAAQIVIEDMPIHEPPILEALLGLPSLTTPKQIEAAWRWIGRAGTTTSWYGKLIDLLAAAPGAEDEARRRLSDEDQSLRRTGLAILEKMQRAGDGDRILFHVQAVLTLSSAYSAAGESLAWLQAEAAKPDWSGRIARTKLPAFSDPIPLRSSDEHGDAVEKLLVQAFPEQIRPHLAAWSKHELETMRERAARMAAALGQGDRSATSP